MERLLDLVEGYRKGKVSRKKLVAGLKDFPFERFLGVTFDSHRAIRTGMKEVIYAPGKSRRQLFEIVRRSLKNHASALVTRVDERTAAALRRRFPRGSYNLKARIFAVGREAAPRRGRKSVAIVTAGAADESVAEEAAIVLEHYGWKTARIYDVGVAGIHRLLAHIEEIEKSCCVIVIAGMEGALPSVVAGLTSKPLIAVPSSSGYGASLGGIAPLLAMLNSCAGGVGVVNIDGGFNAACLAHRICMLTEEERK